MMFLFMFLCMLIVAAGYGNKGKKRGKAKNALLIARQSSKDQDTLKEQGQWIKEIASSRNLHVVKVISDICKGKNFPIKHREEILKIADTAGIDVIVAFKIDRWARNVTSGIMLLDELNEKRKIKIISTEGEYEYSNPNDCFIVRFFLLLAEQEQGQKMDRVFLKISKMMLNGEYPRKSVPLGYKRAKNNKLMPEVWCKKIINDIYDTFISIKNYSKTARDINKKYPKIFAEKLTGSRVEWIIRSEIYIGYLHWGGEFFGEGENNHPRKSLKVIGKNKFDTAQHVADQIRKQYGRDTCSVIEDLVDKYGPEPVLDVMDLKAACPNCGWILKEKNGKEKTKDLFQRKYICKNCRTEFRFPLVRQIKKIEKLVSMPCRKCNAKANFTLLSDDSNFWQLKCDNCNHVILLHEFLGKSDSKNSSNENKGNKGKEDGHDTIQTSFY